MVNNSININKANNNVPPTIVEHTHTLKKDHNIWHWKSKFCLETDTKVWQG